MNGLAVIVIIVLAIALIGGYLIYTSFSFETVDSVTQVKVDSQRIALGVLVVVIGLIGAAFFEKVLNE